MPTFEPGTLWACARAVAERARASGAQLSIPTERHEIEAGGVRFVVRVLTHLARKHAAKDAAAAGRTPGGDDFNPFLPYDRELYVADLDPAHVILLNKYNVVEDHLLVVTREFEEQESLLSRADFEAAWRCLDEIDGLVFYNGGELAGASQRHKHLQLIPLPLGSGERGMPIEAWLESARFSGRFGRAGAVPFEHRVARAVAGDDVAGETFDLYVSMVGALGLGTVGGHQRAPYNLLMTREWLVLAPRRAECFEGISVNAIGLAGGLLVRTELQLRRIEEVGPLAVLEAVGVPRQ